MLVTSIFSFSHNVFKSIFARGRKMLGLYGKELKEHTPIFNRMGEKQWNPDYLPCQIKPKGYQIATRPYYLISFVFILVLQRNVAIIIFLFVM